MTKYQLILTYQFISITHIVKGCIIAALGLILVNSYFEKQMRKWEYRERREGAREVG